MRHDAAARTFLGRPNLRWLVRTLVLPSNWYMQMAAAWATFRDAPRTCRSASQEAFRRTWGTHRNSSQHARTSEDTPGTRFKAKSMQMCIEHSRKHHLVKGNPRKNLPGLVPEAT